MSTHSKKLTRAQSHRPQRFSPEKKADELSKLTPVQFFQKKFGELEVHFHELKKYSPPNGSDQFFQMFVSFKSSIPALALHAAKILKQRTLSAPLNLKSFEACRVFKDELPLFIQSIYNFQNKIRRLYYKSIFGYFSIMLQNFDDFADICKQEPHTRTVFLQYEESCRNSLKNIEATLKSFFEPQRFQTITVDESLEEAENIKTLGRFYMFDLQRILSPYMLLSPSKSPPKFYSQFKAAFEELVPMLSAVPCFRDEYEVLLTKIEPMKESFDKLYKLIGNTPDAIKLKDKPKLTGEQPPIVIEPVDPLKEPLEILSKELNINFDDTESQDYATKIEKVTKEVKETINSLSAELDKTKKRLRILEPLHTKEAIIDRFDQIREFKNEYTKQEEKAKNDFMRNIVFQFKDLAENVQIDLNDNYLTQIRQISSSISDDINQKKAEIEGLKGQINETKAFLSQLTSNDNDDLSQVNLPSLVRESLTKFRSIQKETAETKSKIRNFLKENFDENTNFSDFSTDESLKYIKNHINAKDDEIEELKDQLSQNERSKLAFKKETIDILSEVHSSLNQIINQNDIPSNPPEKLTELKDQVKSILSKLETKQKENQEKFTNFFINLTSVLKLPPVDFTNGEIDEAYETAMTEITDKLTVPTKTDLFLKNNDDDQDFKNFACDLCVRLTQKPKEEFQQLEIEQLKQSIFTDLETVMAQKVDLKKFNKYLPKHEAYEIQKIIKLQLKTAMKITVFSEKLKDISEPEEICAKLKEFLAENKKINSDVIEGFTKITDALDSGKTDVDIIDLNKQIESKDQQIHELSDKIKKCQKQFFDYVEAIKKQNEDNQEMLQSLENQEIRSIVDFFTDFEQEEEDF